MTDPARDLEQALAAMTWREEPGRFALVGFDSPALADDLLALTECGQITREGGETSLLIRAEELTGVLERRPDARVERDLCWYRFEAAMGWEVVGFLARVTTHMAEAGIPVGAVCGFSRDHLFIGAAHRERAREVLAGLFPED